MNKSKYLSMAILMAFSFLFALSCDDKETTEEIIAEEETLLTDGEKQLLHQTPEFVGSSFFEQEQQTMAAIKAATTEETVDGWRIQKDGRGVVTQVVFEDITLQQPPTDGQAYLTRFFGQEAAAQFVKTDGNEEMEVYTQKYGEYEVAQYGFWYDEQGVMQKAIGTYYPIEGLNLEPTIRPYAARMILASYLGQSVKGIYETPHLGIMMKPDGTQWIPTLVYYVSTKSNNADTVSHGEVTFAAVDAHTGRLIFVEHIM